MFIESEISPYMQMIHADKAHARLLVQVTLSGSVFAFFSPLVSELYM